MKQMTLATAGFDRYAKPTRRATFLAEMERVVPWRRLCRLIEPVYPKAGNGRPPIGLERMLRIYFLQHWFNLSAPAVEEALYDSQSMRRFVGIDLGREPAPDETTMCRFRPLLEQHDLGTRMFEEVHRHLEASGIKVYVDGQSVDLLSGSQIDYVDTLMGAGFTVNNPNAVAACGCGSSFRTADDAGSARSCAH